MNKLRCGKKGILFTLGLTFLTLVILALATLIFRNAQEYEGMIAKLAVLDRVYDLDTSIGQSVGAIFNLRAGISINITGGNISFEETLPNEKIKVFNNSLRNFKRFIESNLSNVNLSIDNMEEMPLRIMPEDITYKHKDNWSDIEVVPTGLTPLGYSIFIDVGNINVSCDWDEVVAGNELINIDLEVEGDDDCPLVSDSIDSSANSEITVNSPESGNVFIIKVDAGSLLINLTQDITATVRTTIITNVPDVEVRADSLNLEIDFGEFGVRKEGAVRII